MPPINSFLLFILIVVAAVLLVGSVFAKPIAGAMRRRIPNFDDEADTWLLWGLLGISSLGGLLLLAYLLTRP